MTGRWPMLLPLLLLLAAAPQAWSSEDDREAGREIYESYCTEICHQSPAASRLRPEQWRIVLNTMQKRMASAGMEPLTAVELEQVYRYLTQSEEP